MIRIIVAVVVLAFMACSFASPLNENELKPSTVAPIEIIDGQIKCHVAGAMMAYPDDAHKYIVCEQVNGKMWAHVFSCAPGTKWDQQSSQCNEEHELTSVAPIEIIDGEIKCHAQGATMAYPKDSHKFIVCEQVGDKFRAHIMSCAPGTRFDQQSKQCVLDQF